MSGQSCELVPKVKVVNSNNQIEEQDSELYKGLSKLIKHRPTTNLIYAYYLQNGVDAQMENTGKYKRNNQGQFRAKDVYDFFNVAQMINESMEVVIPSTEKSLGIRDSQGNYIEFDDPIQVLDKVNNFNDTNKSLVAYVIQKGDKFIINLAKRDSRTQSRTVDYKLAKSLWDIIEQAFNLNGLDLDTLKNSPLTKGLANPIYSFSNTGTSNFINYLQSLTNTWNKYLSEKDIYTLLSLNQNSTQVQRLLTKYNTLEDAANMLYRFQKGINTPTPAEKSLMESTLNNCKRFNGLNFQQLNSQLQQETNNVQSQNYDYQVQLTLDDLNRKYNINVNEIHLQGNEIKTLADAVANAVISLQRQLSRENRQLNANLDIQKIKRLEETIKQLSSALNSKKYYVGCLNFLKEANDQILYINDLLNNISWTGTLMEQSIQKANLLIELKGIIDNYYTIVNSLSNLDKLQIDENLSDSDKQNIINQANVIKDSFDKYRELVKELKNEVVTNLTIDILGDKLENGEAIANILAAIEGDGSAFDYLYSFGKTTNPLINVMGKITRDAQDKRDKELNALSWRIEKATQKLYAAGFNSSFMYDNNGYIISDIDWDAFNKDRAAAIHSFKQQGLSGIELTEAIRNWDEAHTEQRVVDFKSGRTEAVPDYNYSKAFPSIAPEQLEYYNEMMQIKGEIGTLLPQYMQKQYLPPQKRRTFIDAISQAKNIFDVIRAIKHKIGDMWKIREDDSYYSKNGVIDGEDYAIGKGDFSNRPLRTIPIFYVRKIKDQNELLKDFSGALQVLAGTAVNYNAMQEVLNLIETFRDFITDLSKAALEGNKKITEISYQNGVRVAKDLVDFCVNNNCVALMEGFISKQFYGENMKNADKLFTRILQGIVKYTSIKALAVNVKGMINNLLSGEWQLLMEAGAGEFFNFKSYAWAQAMLLGEVGKATGKIIDFLNNDRNSYDVLISEIFDPEQSNFFEKSQKRYYKSAFRKIMGIDFTFMGYRIGEYILHKTGMYAILDYIKLTDTINHKKISMYYAYEEQYEDGKKKLVLKKGLIDKDGNVVDENYIQNVRRLVRAANQGMFGVMNEEDKGILHQRIWGRVIMNLRQWMVEVYSKRFRKEYWDANTGKLRESSYYTLLRLIRGGIENVSKFRFETAIHKDDLTDVQKANLRRVIAEQLVITSLLLLQFALGEPEDHKKEFWYRMWIYQTKRSLQEVGSATPIGTVVSLPSMINSPIPATNTLSGWLYPFVGLGDIDKTIKSGPYKGENKYIINTARNTLPFWKQMDQLYRMDEDESIYSVFDTSNMLR